MDYPVVPNVTGTKCDLTCAVSQNAEETMGAFTLTRVQVTGIQVPGIVNTNLHVFQISNGSVHIDTSTLRVRFSLVRVVLHGSCF